MQAINSSPIPQKIQSIPHESPQPKQPTNNLNVVQQSLDGVSSLHNSTLSLVADVSTTEGSEIHTPTKARTLTLKKKHSLINKRRNVNLKILGTGDIQGYLFRRTKDKRGVTFWARLYFVMLDTILYGFRSKEASKANCVIFLPGFTVSLAKEVHSKPFAFKVYHSAKTFYFAAESQDALNQWVEFIRQSTLAQNNNTINGPEAEVNARTLFSENDSSSEENESVVIKNLCTPSPQANRDSLPSASASVSTKTPTTTPISTKSDRYLGSLRKLTKGSLQFKSSSTNEKKMSNDIPVPTEQFRSYRKVPGGSYGIQIGANTPAYHDSSLHPFNVSNEHHQTSQQHQQVAQQRQSTQQHHNLAVTVPNEKPANSLSRKSSGGWDTTVATLEPPSSPAPVPYAQKDITSITENEESTDFNIPQTRLNDEETTQQPPGVTSPSKSIKKIPYNFIHASNPNLVEFDFQTSRTLDYNLPKINSADAWDALPTNIQGFVTLKDLMLQKQEEEAQEMYNNRVLLGVEKKEDHKRSTAQKQPNQSSGVNDESGGSHHCEDVKVSKTQSRSLPKPPDYEISFKPDDEDIQLTRTKEGLKLRDFGYELISGDEPLGASSNTSRQYLQTNRQPPHHSDIHDSLCSNSNWTSAMKSKSFLLSSSKLKKNSTSSSCSSADFNLGSGGERRLGSFKKKGKLESFKTSSEKIFQFGKHSSCSSGAGTTMTLPLNKKSSNLTSEACGNGNTGIKKSQTYNNELKEKAGKYDAQRKNSAPMPIFAKLSFSSSSSTPNSNSKSESKKVNKNCNSPHFHRALFGHQNNANSPQQNSSGNSAYSGREYDQEIFSQVVFPKKNTNRKQSIITSIANNDIITAPDTTAPPPPTKTYNTNENSQTTPNVPTTEYPNMECPPVFEPDIYSLDPNASLLLRRNNNNNPNSRENENK
uniref:PH domain protein n=1 Tax=Musca domestica TaxID=7370 RepID=T1PDD9_MUSDO